MSQIIKPVALDETLQSTNQKLDTLKSGIDSKASDIKTAIDQQKSTIETQAGNIKTAIDQQKNTLDSDINGTNSMLSVFANAMVEVLASVKSINGKYGVVVLDSGDLLINKNASGSKTVKTMVEEMQEAIAKTPLHFSTESNPDISDDYTLMVTLGTPA